MVENAYDKYKGHTEGPWTEDICTRGPDGEPIGIQTCTEYALEYGKGNPESRANAILIADAPMLLEQNKRMLGFIYELFSDVFVRDMSHGQVRSACMKIIKEIEG